MKRFLIASFFMALWLPMSGRADILYDFTTPIHSTHIEFQLPLFVQHVGPLTSFNLATSTEGSPIALFDLSGSSTEACSGSYGGSSFSAPGNCFGIIWNDHAVAVALDPLIAFSGLGTYSSDIFALTITEVPAIPEPSSVAMLFTTIGLVAVLFSKARST